MAYDEKTKKRFALPVDPPIPPHMRIGALSKGQRDAFAATDRLTAKAERKSPAARSAGKRDRKARAATKTVSKAASRSRKDTRAASPEVSADNAPAE